MRIAVFSDVHGNLPALEIMLKEIGSVDGYICIGDMVNYGPWSDECVDRIILLPNRIVIEGNHERYFLNGQYDGTNLIAQCFFDFCYPSFSSHDKIKGLPQQYLLNNFTFQHTIEDKNIYPDTPIKLGASCVIGHSHHQFKISQPPFVLINPGSVGQNRKYINVINYALLETEHMKFTMKSVVYDDSLIISELKKRGYPRQCIAYYDDKERFHP